MLDTGLFDDIDAEVHPDIGSLITVTWQQSVENEAWVETRIDGEDWRETPVAIQPNSPTSQVVAGLSFDVDVEYRVVGAQEVSPAQTICANSLPPGLVAPTVLVDQANARDLTAPWLLLAVGESGVGDISTWAVILDEQSRVIWARPSEPDLLTIHPQVGRDGTLLIDQSSFYTAFDFGRTSRIVRMYLDGTEVSSTPTPGMHHPFSELSDGSLVWTAVDRFGGETIERISPDGTQDTVFDCAPFMEMVKATTYCGSNTVNYREDTGTLLYSMYSTDTVVEIDIDSGKALRWFGHLGGAWSFEPDESAFWWQHGPTITEAGTLLVSTKNEQDGDETVVREYQLNPSTETLEQIWSFGIGEGVYGPEMGEAHRLPGGNTLQNFGTTPRIREITPNNEVCGMCIGPMAIPWDGCNPLPICTPCSHPSDGPTP